MIAILVLRTIVKASKASMFFYLLPAILSASIPNSDFSRRDIPTNPSTPIAANGESCVGALNSLAFDQRNLVRQKGKPMPEFLRMLDYHTRNGDVSFVEVEIDAHQLEAFREITENAIARVNQDRQSQGLWPTLFLGPYYIHSQFGLATGRIPSAHKLSYNFVVRDEADYEFVKLSLSGWVELGARVKKFFRYDGAMPGYVPRRPASKAREELALSVLENLEVGELLVAREGRLLVIHSIPDGKTILLPTHHILFANEIGSDIVRGDLTKFEPHLLFKMIQEKPYDSVDGPGEIVPNGLGEVSVLWNKLATMAQIAELIAGIEGFEMPKPLVVRPYDRTVSRLNSTNEVDNQARWLSLLRLTESNLVESIFYDRTGTGE
jgi:hypothetical protein